MSDTAVITSTQNPCLPRRRVIFGQFLAIALAAFALFYFNNTSFLGVNAGKAFNDPEFFITTGALVWIELTVLITAKRNFHIKEKPVLFILCLAAAICSCIGVYFYGGTTYDGATFYTLSKVEKIRYMIEALMLFATFYQMYTYIPYFVKGRTFIRVIMVLVVIQVMAAIGYSVWKEFDSYKAIIDGNFGVVVVKSYTVNKNAFGFLLFCGIAAECFLAVERPHIWRWLIIGAFFVTSCFTYCKASMTMSAILIFLFVCYSIRRDFKTKHGWSGFFLLLLLIAAIGGVVAILILKPSDGILGKATSVLTKIQTYFTDKLKGDFEARLSIWNISYDAVSGSKMSLLFGNGYWTGRTSWYWHAYGHAVFSEGDTLALDMMWASQLIEGGLVGVGFTALIWFWILCLIFKNYFKGSRYSSYYLAVFITLLFRSLLEATSITMFDADGLAYFGILLLPMLIEDVRRDRVFNKETITILDSPLPENKPNVRYISRAFAVLFLPAIALALFPYINADGTYSISYFDYPYWLFSSIIMAVLGTLALSGVLDAFNNRKMGRWFIYGLLFLIYIGSVVALPFFSSAWWTLAVQGGIALVLIVLEALGGCMKHFGYSINAYFCNLLVYGVAAGIIFMFFAYAVKTIVFFETVCFFALAFSYWIFFYFMPRKNSRIFSPYDFESNIRNDMAQRKQIKRDHKFNKKTMQKWSHLRYLDPNSI